MQKHRKRVYDYLRSIGEYRDNEIDIIDNSGPAATSPAFRVHLKGGVYFETFVDDEGVYFECYWQGCLPDKDERTVVAWMIILGINI